MLLERRLVKILWEKMKKGVSSDRLDFIQFVVAKKWPRWYYFRFRSDDQQFKNMVSYILEDCISYGYIKETEGGKIIFVTKKGRNFIKIPLGFSEEFLKRRKRTVVGGIVIILTSFIVHFWPWIFSKLGL